LKVTDNQYDRLS